MSTNRNIIYEGPQDLLIGTRPLPMMYNVFRSLNFICHDLNDETIRTKTNCKLQKQIMGTECYERSLKYIDCINDLDFCYTTVENVSNLPIPKNNLKLKKLTNKGDIIKFLRYFEIQSLIRNTFIKVCNYYIKVKHHESDFFKRMKKYLDKYGRVLLENIVAIENKSGNFSDLSFYYLYENSYPNKPLISIFVDEKNNFKFPFFILKNITLIRDFHILAYYYNEIPINLGSLEQRIMDESIKSDMNEYLELLKKIKQIKGQRAFINFSIDQPKMPKNKKNKLSANRVKLGIKLEELMNNEQLLKNKYNDDTVISKFMIYLSLEKWLFKLDYHIKEYTEEMDINPLISQVSIPFTNTRGLEQLINKRRYPKLSKILFVKICSHIIGSSKNNKLGRRIPNSIPNSITNLNSSGPVTGGKKYIYIKNIGKRKIRYYKNGNPYVIIKGKKKKLKYLLKTNK